MKLISWNVNGLRSILRGHLYEYLAKEKPDVLCLSNALLVGMARRLGKLRPGPVGVAIAMYDVWRRLPRARQS